MAETAGSYHSGGSEWPQLSVRQLLLEKGFGALIMSPDAAVLDALDRMQSGGASAAAVTQNGWLVGIFTERDYVTRVVGAERLSSELTLREVMTTNVVSVPPEASLDECLTLMQNHRVRYLPVLDRDRVIGMISLSDVVRAAAREEREFLSLFPASGVWPKSAG